MAAPASPLSHAHVPDLAAFNHLLIAAKLNALALLAQQLADPATSPKDARLAASQILRLRPLEPPPRPEGQQAPPDAPAVAPAPSAEAQAETAASDAPPSPHEPVVVAPVARTRPSRPAHHYTVVEGVIQRAPADEPSGPRRRAWP